ncbi:MAG: c-type cytochrome [Phenylobacterium sp.]
MRLTAFAVLMGLSATPALAADGAKVFAAQCKVCHQANTSVMAPSLAGVKGAKIASKPGFNYSAGLKAKASQTWTDANLDAFLTKPGAFAPGTRMVIAVPSAENRAALIQYLGTLK